jgi:hypothetical protein
VAKRFGDPARLSAALQALAEYNKSQGGDFSRFNYSAFSLKYFGKDLLPPRKQGNHSSSAVAAQGIISAQSSCGQT